MKHPVSSSYFIALGSSRTNADSYHTLSRAAKDLLNFLSAVRVGGTIATTFPQHFWNIPLRMRENLGRENTPAGFGFYPETRYDPAWAGWYTHAVARVPDGATIQASPVFPFRLVADSGTWRDDGLVTTLVLSLAGHGFCLLCSAHSQIGCWRTMRSWWASGNGPVRASSNCS